MKMKFRSSLFLSLLLFPVNAYASGNDVIYFAWLEISLFIIMVIFMFVSKLNIKYRIFVFIAYIISMPISFWTMNFIPVDYGSSFINNINILMQIFFCGAAWVWCVRKLK